MVPVFILIGMAVPATRTLIEIEDATNTELTIKVTGYQWKWRYEYLESGVELLLDASTGPATPRASWAPASIRTPCRTTCSNVDHPLVVPVGTKVRLLITGAGRDPRLVGAGVRREEGRDPRLRQRSLVQDRRGQDRPLPRPVRRAVRPRPRLHADRRRRALARRSSRPGCKTPAGSSSGRADPAQRQLAADGASTPGRHRMQVERISTWPTPHTTPHAHDAPRPQAARAGGAGSSRPTTRTSARCT